MLGEIWYIFRKYGERLAKKYGEDSCRLYMNINGSGGLEGFNEDDPFMYNFLTWVSLDDAVKLLRKEVLVMLESGGKKWT